MPWFFSFESSLKVRRCLALGVAAVQCFGLCGMLQVNTWAQEPGNGTPKDQALQSATEAQIKDLWIKMQGDSIELEGTDPRAAITRYQKFFEQGAGRFPSVGVQIALRIARLYQLDLGNSDKAIEIYDWAIGLYANRPELAQSVAQLQQGRLAAIRAQAKAQGTKGPRPGPAPLAVPVPQSTTGANLGISLPATATGTNLGIRLPPATTGAKIEVGAPSLNTSNVAPSVVPLLAPRGNALGWQPRADRCVTALAQQQRGTLWVATEDSGVWRYNPSIARPQDRWQQFTSKDGLADDSAYALAVDKQNRVWVGTLNHGVSVWNGQAWKNYGVLDGPLGERVFAIKVCPTNGDVWIATNAGLTRYSAKNDTWSYLTRGDGLPSDQVQAIAFDPSGNIVIGTQCDGVALAKAADGYKTWQVVKGPDEVPVTATGKGLPSSLINDVLVDKDGTIYAATTTGLAWSSDGGANWSYVRGQDYADKVKGSYAGPPSGWSQESGAVLAEDYVSCLAEGEAGQIWLGHWQAGSEMVQMQSGPVGLRLKEVPHRQDSGLVRAILPRSNGALLLARYNDGLSYSDSVAGQGIAKAKPVAADVVASSAVSVPSLPSVAKAPTLDELNALLASLGKIKPLDSKVPLVAPLPDDWTTQGDWLGRYGRYWASLNAMVSPRNYYWGGGWTPIEHAFQISPKQKEDSLRYWVHWMQTDEPRSLEMPPTYLDSRLQKGLTTPALYRRQSELDDHGEAYPPTKEGPNIYFSVSIPPGLWTLSFYNDNKDGHQDENRMRDYLYSVYFHDPSQRLGDVMNFDDMPSLAQSRQRDFWSGVYERFLVRGPIQLTVEVAKNNSHNTLLSGAFLDLVDEQPAPYFGTVDKWHVRQNAREQEINELLSQSVTARAARFAPASDEADAAGRLFLEVERLRDLNPIEWAQRSRPVYEALARWARMARSNTNLNKNTQLLKQEATCFYWMNSYSNWEVLQRREGLTPARDIEKSLKWDGQSSDGEGFQVITAHLPHLKVNNTR